ncbi:hypothetical protein CY35_17G023600 [Sphagnum magellanicum]|nr:hypothetical protein CY35_17G023600 [Sphagnum magellanicum]
MTQVAKHIDEGRLKMKTDCPILTDVALRQKALEVLLSYNPTWLRLGLVVVLGPLALLGDIEMPKICSKGAEEVISENALLEVLLEQQFLADAVLAKQHARNRSIEGLYRDGYKEALGKLILKRILLLVLVLDKIKCETALNSGHGIDGLDGGSPLLFRVNTLVKSSRQALEVFLLDSMQGEGDLISHLGKSGYYVSHIQAPLCEYNFEVQNVVADLQDGIHLCRLAQLMSHDLSVLVELRCPCDLRKKRLHNCKVALESLACAGVPLQDELGACITADHIVDGQRDKILSLLWNVILYLQIPKLVSHPKLWKQIFEAEGPQGSFSMDPGLDTRGYAILDVLLAWTQAVCSTLGAVKVNNFNTCFLDGQVLCYLVSYYLPSHLPHQAILPTVNQTLHIVSEQNSEITGQHGQYECQGLPTREGMTLQARETTAHNFQLLEHIVKKHGNLPQVLELTDLVEGDPCTSERNIIIFVAYLCCWLVNMNLQDVDGDDVVGMDPSNLEDTSTDKQNLEVGLCQRLSENPSPTEYHTIQYEAAIRIQAWYKGYLQQQAFKMDKLAVTTLQRFLRGWLARLTLRKSQREENGVASIQVSDHGYCLQHSILQRKLASTDSRSCHCSCGEQEVEHLYSTNAGGLGSVVAHELQERGEFLTTEALTTSQAASVKWELAATQIQTCYRGYVQRRKYHLLKMRVVRLQALIRGKLVRWKFILVRGVVLRIQGYWWGQSARQMFLRKRLAATKIQCCYRAYVQRRRFLLDRRAVVRFQAVLRGILVRKRKLLHNLAVGRLQTAWQDCDPEVVATRIQCWYRCYAQRKLYCARRTGIIRLQAVVRGKLVRQQLKVLMKSVNTIQACWQGYCLRCSVLEWKDAATQIQSWWRGCGQRKGFHMQRDKVVMVQACVRGNQVRKRLQILRQAVIRIEAAWWAHCLKLKTLKQMHAAMRIQAGYHAHVQRMVYCKSKKAIVQLQAIVRGVLVRRRMKLFKEAVSKIQSTWRGYCRRQTFLKWTVAATSIQSCHRGHVQRRMYRRTIEAVTKIQVAFRCLQQRKKHSIQMQKDSYALNGQEQALLIHQPSYSSEVFAASTIQQYWRVHLMKEKVSAELCEKEIVGPVLNPPECRYSTVELDAGRVLTILAKTQHDRLSFLRLRKLAIVIQSHFHGFQARKYFAHVKKSACLIQAHWKGHEWRKRQGHVMKQMQQLRFRMQITASKVDNSQRLGHRLTNALAQLLSQKTVSGILHTCATIDMATEHSKQCCERLAEGGAILKLLQLIQTTNRSPPHEQVLKHALSILANLARFPDLALRIVNTSDSIMIIAEQLLVFRNKEEVFSKAMEVVQNVCSTPGCAEIIKTTSLVIRRLQNVAQMLERKHDVEKRNLDKIPQSQPILRKAAERKLKEIGSHHFNIISTLQHFALGVPAVYGADKPNFTQKDRRSSMIGAPSQLLVAPSQLRTPFQAHIAGNKSKVSIQAKVPRAALTDRSNY